MWACVLCIAPEEDDEDACVLSLGGGGGGAGKGTAAFKPLKGGIALAVGCGGVVSNIGCRGMCWPGPKRSAPEGCCITSAAKITGISTSAGWCCRNSRVNI